MGNASYHYLQGLISATGLRPSGISRNVHPEVRKMMRETIPAAVGKEILESKVDWSVDAACAPFFDHLWSVPEYVMRASRDHVAAFLRGVFDANAHLTERGQLLVNLPKEMLVSVQVLLQGLGISSHILKRPARAKCPHDSLVIYFTEDLRRFREIIGLSHRRTQEEMGFIQPVSQEQVPLIPEISGAGNTEMSKEWLAETLSTYPEFIQEKYRPVFEHDVIPVVSVREGIMAPVWDIEVDGDHEYMTPFHCAHNCERSADVLTAGWLSDEMKAQKRLQLQCLKSRDTAPFDPFLARIDFSCGRIFSTNEVPMTREEKKAVGDRVDSELKDLL
jgi:hypothetical protein